MMRSLKFSLSAGILILSVAAWPKAANANLLRRIVNVVTGQPSRPHPRPDPNPIPLPLPDPGPRLAPIAPWPDGKPDARVPERISTDLFASSVKYAKNLERFYRNPAKALKEATETVESAVDAIGDLLTFGEHGPSPDEVIAPPAEEPPNTTPEQPGFLTEKKRLELEAQLGLIEHRVKEWEKFEARFPKVLHKLRQLLQFAEEILSQREEAANSGNFDPQASVEERQLLKVFVQILQNVPVNKKSAEPAAIRIWDESLKAFVEIVDTQPESREAMLQKAIKSADSETLKSFVVELGGLYHQFDGYDQKMREKILSGKEKIKTLQEQIKALAN